MKRYLFALALSSLLMAPAFAGPSQAVAPPTGPVTNALEVAETLYADWTAELGEAVARERLSGLERATGAALVEHVEHTLPEGASEAVGEAALEQAHP